MGGQRVSPRRTYLVRVKVAGELRRQDRARHVDQVEAKRRHGAKVRNRLVGGGRQHIINTTSNRRPARRYANETMFAAFCAQGAPHEAHRLSARQLRKNPCPHIPPPPITSPLRPVLLPVLWPSPCLHERANTSTHEHHQRPHYLTFMRAVHAAESTGCCWSTASAAGHSAS
jgi:hypothetical protein